MKTLKWFDNQSTTVKGPTSRNMSNNNESQCYKFICNSEYLWHLTFYYAIGCHLISISYTQVKLRQKTEKHKMIVKTSQRSYSTRNDTKWQIQFLGLFELSGARRVGYHSWNPPKRAKFVLTNFTLYKIH